MSDWPTAALSDLVEPDSPITYGVVKPGDNPSDGVLFIRGGDIADGRINLAALRRIGSDVSGQYRRTLLRGGELVVSLVGNPGQVAVVPDGLAGANIARQVGLVRLGSAVDTQFIKYFLLSPRGQEALGAHALGSVQQVINLRDLKTVDVPLPSLEEQRAIAAVLGALDDKIEQNRRMARALERLARAIFRAWFVDFEPVKAKAAGATTFSSMPQAVFDALPTRFVDSDIGPVPEGWEVKALDNVADFLNGLALQKYPPRGDGTDFPVIKIAQLRKGSTEGADASNDSIDEKYKIQDRDLLFSWSGTLEAVIWFGGPGALNQHLFKVTSSGYPQWLVYEWIQQHLSEFRLIAASKATTMGHIKRGHLSKAMVAVPPPALLEKGNQLVSPLFDMNASAQLESRKLAEMRNYLLPKLLSGDVRVDA